MPPTNTPVAPTIDNVLAQVQHEIDDVAEEVNETEQAIANHIQALPDSYPQLNRALAAKGADAGELYAAHAKFVMEHPAKLKALRESLIAYKAKKQELAYQKAKLLGQLNDPGA